MKINIRLNFKQFLFKELKVLLKDVERVQSLISYKTFNRILYYYIQFFVSYEKE